MILLAANNRFRLMPQLAFQPAVARTNLAWSIGAETMLGLAAVLLATAIGDGVVPQICRP